MSEPDRVCIDGLRIAGPQRQLLLDGATVRLGAGEIRGLIGHSGVGKTTLMRTVLGCLPPQSTRVSGSVQVLGQDVLDLQPSELQRFRRRHVAFVAQDPGACLNPTMRLASLLKEVAPKGTKPDLGAALEQVQLPSDFLRRRPGELSGGQQRRVALARALVRGVEILLVDEPLAGLDGPVRRQIAAVLRTLVETRGVSMIVTGHQVDLVRDLSDDVVEIGRGAEPDSDPEPRNGAPQVIQRAIPDRQSMADLPTPASPDGEPALAASGISVSSSRADILTNVELRVVRGRTTAVIGPSGAGKTTLARVLVGLQRQASGSLRIADRNVRIAAERRRRVDRGRVQYIPQNPLSTLNPKKTVRQTIARPIKRLGTAGASEVDDRVRRLTDAMGLEAELIDRYPHQLSGGQRQRVAIARALAAEPEVLVCDEITSALDRRTADAILDDLRSRVVELGLSVVLISHELAEVREFADHVYVMAGGRVIESGSTYRVFNEPSNQQTRELLS